MKSQSKKFKEIDINGDIIQDDIVSFILYLLLLLSLKRGEKPYILHAQTLIHFQESWQEDMSALFYT